MSVEVLLQLDRLVQLLEAPPFTRLRLHLLQPSRYPALIRCLALCLWTPSVQLIGGKDDPNLMP